MLLSILTVVVTSAICGAAQNTTMLIAGRAVQGIGGGRINILVDVIICDLVPLRDRGNIIGLLFALISVGLSFGPLVGGVIAGAGQWRWVFLLNVPVGMVAFVALFFSLRVSHRGDLSWEVRLRRINYTGNTILVASTILVLYMLTYGGSRYAWSDAHIVAPLVVGLVLMVAFFFYERSSLCHYPVTPPQLFSNRTTCAAFYISSIHSMMVVRPRIKGSYYFQKPLHPMCLFRKMARLWRIWRLKRMWWKRS